MCKCSATQVDEYLFFVCFFYATVSGLPFVCFLSSVLPFLFSFPLPSVGKHTEHTNSISCIMSVYRWYSDFQKMEHNTYSETAITLLYTYTMEPKKQLSELNRYTHADGRRHPMYWLLHTHSLARWTLSLMHSTANKTVLVLFKRSVRSEPLRRSRSVDDRVFWKKNNKLFVYIFCWSCFCRGV